MERSLFSLQGKVIVVTGCARGIGRGLAVGLAQAGADIVGIDFADIHPTAQAVEAVGRRFYPFACDLSSREEIDRIWNAILATVDHVDALFNNAGMQHRESAYTYPVEVFDQILAVNLRSQYLLAQKAACQFRQQGTSGRIINTASLFTTFGGMDVCGYTVSKHGVLGLTRSLSNEFAADGITVNAIAPGYIATEMTQSIWSDPEKSAPIEARIPAGRWGKPDDFAGVAVFLASDASAYITGAIIPVDGGYTCR